jgi:hypothetical protein
MKFDRYANLVPGASPNLPRTSLSSRECNHFQAVGMHGLEARSRVTGTAWPADSVGGLSDLPPSRPRMPTSSRRGIARKI